MFKGLVSGRAAAVVACAGGRALKQRRGVATFFATAMVALTGCISGPNVPALDLRDHAGDYPPSFTGLHKDLHNHLDQAVDSAVEAIKLGSAEAVGGSHCKRGWVLLEFMVTPAGELEDIEVVAQDYTGLFEKTAIHALRASTFKPAVRAGEPIHHSAIQSFVFPLMEGCESGPVHEPPHKRSSKGSLSLTADMPHGVQAGRFWMTPISGNFFGYTNDRSIHYQEWRRGESIELDLEKMTERVKPLLASASLAYLRAGLQVDPPAAHFARVGHVFTTTNGDRTVTKSSRLAEGEKRLMLVHIDRAATFRGTVVSDDYTHDYDILFPGAGFYWVNFQSTKKGGKLTLAHEIDQPTLIIGRP